MSDTNYNQLVNNNKLLLTQSILKPKFHSFSYMSIITAEHHKVINSKINIKNTKYNNINISIKKFLNPTSPIAKLSAQFFFPKQHDYN